MIYIMSQLISRSVYCFGYLMWWHMYRVSYLSFFISSDSIDETQVTDKIICLIFHNRST